MEGKKYKNNRTRKKTKQHKSPDMEYEMRSNGFDWKMK